MEDLVKLEKAREILLKIANGIDPVTGVHIDEDSFLNDPRIIRCFYFVSEILENVAKGVYSANREKLTEFVITPEQKQMVKLPEHKIGVNEFTKCVNSCLDPNKSKRLTGVELNKKLKALGILSEEKLESGKTRTTVNENSADFGFEAERKNYNGNEYEMVVINDKGKQYLLENIESIMATQTER